MPAKGRVLLIGCSTSIAHMVRETLSRATGGPFEVYHAHQLSDALAQLDRMLPDVVFLDSSLKGAGRLDALTELRHWPRAPSIIMLVRPAEQDLAQEALGRGAAGYMVKDDLWELDGSRLVRTIEAAWRVSRDAGAGRSGIRAMRSQPALARVLAFLGAQGGAGTTQVALGVARTLRAAGKRVIVVELRTAAGALAARLGVQPGRTLSQLANSPLDERTIEPLLTPVGDGLTVLFAGDGAPFLTAERTDALLDTLAHWADAVVIDVPRDGSAGMQAALRRASVVSIVTGMDALGLRQARQTADALREVSLDEARVGAVIVHREGAAGTELPGLATQIDCRVLAVMAGRGPHVAPAIRELALRLMEDEVRAVAAG